MQEDLDRLFNAILLNTEGMIYNLGTNNKDKEEFTAFNNLAIIKKIFDLSILEFWNASVATALRLEIDTKNKILDIVSKKLFNFLNSLPQQNSLGSLILPKNSVLRMSDIIKRKDELELFYRQDEYDENAQVNLGYLFDTVFSKRILQYNDACDTNFPCKPNFFAVGMRFYEDVFGEKPNDYSSGKFNLFVTIHLSTGLGFYSDEIYLFNTIPLKYLDKGREKDRMKAKIKELKTVLTLHKIFYEHSKPQITDKEYEELKKQLHHYENLLNELEE